MIIQQKEFTLPRMLLPPGTRRTVYAGLRTTACCCQLAQS